MRAFTTIALIVVTAMVLSPFWLLDRHAAEIPPVVIGYRDDGSPIVETNPVIRFASYGAAIRSIDPATCGDTLSGHLQAHFYEGLYAYHYLKRPLEIIPQLAAELPDVSADGLTYTIRLRPDIAYCRNPCFGPDGPDRWATRAVTARDVALSVKRIADSHLNAAVWPLIRGRIVGLDTYHEQTLGYQRDDLSRYDLQVEGLQILDDHTLQIRLTEPFDQLVDILVTHQFAPMPREAVDHWQSGDSGIEITEADQVVSTGPYLLKTFDRRRRIILIRNPDFRHETYPFEGAAGDAEAGLLADAGRRVPFVDVIQMDYVAEEYASWMRFLNREVDTSSIQPELFDSLVTPDRTLAEKWRQRHIRLATYEPPAIYWLAFNMDDPVLSASPSLRRAICLAVDVESFITLLRNGRGRRAVNCIPSAFRNLSPSAYAAHESAGPGPHFRFDLQAAQEMLSAAKEELTAADLLVDGSIPPLRLAIGGRGALQVKIGDFYRQQFARLRLDVRIEPNDWPTLLDRIHSRQFQMVTLNWRATCPDAENFLQLFYGGNIGATNTTGYINAEFDALFERARAFPDGPERTEAHARMAEIISEECPVLPTIEPEAFVLHYDWVKNFKPHPIGLGFAKYIRIDVQQRRQAGGRER